MFAGTLTNRQRKTWERYRDRGKERAREREGGGGRAGLRAVLGVGKMSKIRHTPKNPCKIISETNQLSSFLSSVG